MRIEAVAKVKGEDRKVESEFEFGSDLSDSVEKFDETVVYNNFIASAKVSAQAFIRTLAAAVDKEGNIVNSDDDIQEKLLAWKVPDKTGRKADKSAKIIALMASLSDEDRAALLGQLTDEEEVEEE